MLLVMTFTFVSRCSTCAYSRNQRRGSMLNHQRISLQSARAPQPRLTTRHRDARAPDRVPHIHTLHEIASSDINTKSSSIESSLVEPGEAVPSQTIISRNRLEASPVDRVASLGPRAFVFRWPLLEHAHLTLRAAADMCCLSLSLSPSLLL